MSWSYHQYAIYGINQATGSPAATTARLCPFSARSPMTVVVISHDFVGLDGLCPRILHLRDGVMAPAPTAAGGMP